MLTVQSPDGRLALHLTGRRGGGAVWRLALADRPLLSGAPLAWPAAGDDVETVWRELRLPGRGGACLARELQLVWRTCGGRRQALRLRCGNGGAAWWLPPGSEPRWRFPAGVEALVATPACGGYRRLPLTPRLLRSAPLPLTLLYPHGRCAALVRPASAAHPSGWWVLLAGERPCDLPERALLAQGLTDRAPDAGTAAAPPLDAAADAPPDADTGADTGAASAHNCTLPFVVFPGWAGGQGGAARPRAAGTTVAHRLALGVVLGRPPCFADLAPAPSALPSGVLPEPWPAAWDESRFLRGEPGEYLLVARRLGRVWYLAAITGPRGRCLTLQPDGCVPGAGGHWRLWQDDPADGKGLAASRGVATAAERPLVTLAPHGGFVMQLETPEGG